ncbi:MAG TPA: pantetheine-phosphate adenylyltransferase [Candidatus Omnitrophota bacterium]|nr:pantetheine-phosphate adenylyltransferase [Candidatus Omnitrophota bacterium]
MKRVAIYPGSFDPITLGHLDLIQRASLLFDEIIVAVAKDTPKDTLFTADERMQMLQKATQGMKGVSIEVFEGLVIEFARKRNAKVLIRGLRMISDFEYELQMALTNRRLAEEIEMVFLMPSEGHQFLSSTLIKEAARLGADMSSFVPKGVAEKLNGKRKKK